LAQLSWLDLEVRRAALILMMTCLKNKLTAAIIIWGRRV
jgi:hypothetical protein